MLAGKMKKKIKKAGEVIEDRDFKQQPSSYHIMTINTSVRLPGYERRELIVSIIKRSSASVIFCQEVPGLFLHRVVAKCGNYGFSYRRRRVQSSEAVMWRKTDFQGKEIAVTDSLIKEILDSLEKDPSVDVSEMIRTGTTMVKLTSATTKLSFLAVSWRGPHRASVKDKLKTFDGLICFLREVCKMAKLSSFIIGGNFNLDTSTINLHEGVTISRYDLCARDKNRYEKSLQRPGRHFIRFKNTFVVSVTVPSDERLMTVDIAESSVKPYDLESESSEMPLLDEVPVVGELVCSYKKPFIKQDRGTLERYFEYVVHFPADYRLNNKVVIMLKLFVKVVEKSCTACSSHISSFLQFQNTLFVFQICEYFQVNNIVDCFNRQQIFVWT